MKTRIVPASELSTKTLRAKDYIAAEPKHPNQPLVIVDDVVRFKQNKIVRTLLDTGILDLNKLWTMMANGLFPLEDMEQFYQLIGYSVSGYGEMSQFSREKIRAADRKAKKLLAKRRGDQ